MNLLERRRLYNCVFVCLFVVCFVTLLVAFRLLFCRHQGQTSCELESGGRGFMMRLFNHHERVTHAIGNHKSFIQAAPVMGPIIGTTERKGGVGGLSVREEMQPSKPPEPPLQILNGPRYNLAAPVPVSKIEHENSNTCVK